MLFLRVAQYEIAVADSKVDIREVKDKDKQLTRVVVYDRMGIE